MLKHIIAYMKQMCYTCHGNDLVMKFIASLERHKQSQKDTCFDLLVHFSDVCYHDQHDTLVKWKIWGRQT